MENEIISGIILFLTLLENKNTIMLMLSRISFIDYKLQQNSNLYMISQSKIINLI